MNDTHNSEEQELVGPDNIFSKIWTSPKEVFGFIDKHRYDKHVTILLVLSGMARAFDRASTKNLGDNWTILGVISFCIIIGGLFGWITYYIYAALVSWTGNWIGGKADTQAILRILSYSMLPVILALVLLIPQIAIYGNGIFQSSLDDYKTGIIGNIIFYFSIVIEFVLSIWTIILCVIGLSVTQKFSIGKSIINLLLPAVFFVALALILFLVINLTS